MNQERIFEVIKEPHTSEKSTILAEKRKQFTFKVLKNATKKEIKTAIEKLFNVKVSNVTVANVRGKTKRFRMRTGQRSDWKKAYVTLLPGQDIDFSITE